MQAASLQCCCPRSRGRAAKLGKHTHTYFHLNLFLDTSVVFCLNPGQTANIWKCRKLKKLRTIVRNVRMDQVQNRKDSVYVCVFVSVRVYFQLRWKQLSKVPHYSLFNLTSHFPSIPSGEKHHIMSVCCVHSCLLQPDRPSC